MSTKKKDSFARFIAFAIAYADQSGDSDELVFPQDLTTLAQADIEALHTQATESFDALYADGKGLTDDDYTALSAIGEGIKRVEAELAARSTAASERDERAAQLAAEVRGTATAEAEEAEDAEGAEGDEPESSTGENPDAEAAAADEAEAEALAASAATGPTRVSLAAVRGRQARTPAPAAEPGPEATPTVLVASGDGLGTPVGQGVTFREAGAMLVNRLKTFNEKQYAAAQARGSHITETHHLVQVPRHFPEELIIDSDRDSVIETVLDYATNEKRLKSEQGAGSLVAAGGWCAPSEIDYGLGDEPETRNGLLSLPEVNIRRGGLSFTTGIDFRDIFKDLVTFSFTEEQDIAGEYAPGENPGDPNVVGDKPCFTIACPEFDEYRLDVDGICITNGILQARAYPEVQARIIRGALVAHDHRMDARTIAQIEAGSTAIAMPSLQVGATAPILTAIELQAEHYRQSRRMGDVTLEALFPAWINGVIRADLARRQGVDLISVPDSRIRGWFAERRINPQFLVNWQPIDATPASSFVQWPSTVKFMLYSAGTWFKGVQDLLTLNSIYDSALLGQNNFMALFSEDAQFTAMRGQDSRVVSVPLSANGATAAGVNIAHNGTLVTTP